MLTLRPADGVEITRVLGDPPTSFGAGGLKVQVPDAIAGDQINLVVELAIDPPVELGPWQSPRHRVWRPSRSGGERGIAVGGRWRSRSRGSTAVGRGRSRGRRLRRHRPGRRGPRPRLASARRPRQLRRRCPGVARAARDAVAATPGYDDSEALSDVFETLVDDITAMENRPDPESYAAYRKAQHGYANFAAGGHKGRSQTYLGGHRRRDGRRRPRPARSARARG